MKHFTNIDGNFTSYSKNGIKANARIQIEQGINLVLKSMKLKTPRQPHDKALLMTDSRYKQYKANEIRINLKDGLLFRNFFGGTAGVKYYQVFIPEQLVNEFSAACMENLENTQELPKQ